jgi:hypothetical protein
MLVFINAQKKQIFITIMHKTQNKQKRIRTTAMLLSNLKSRINNTIQGYALILKMKDNLILILVFISIVVIEQMEEFYKFN